MASIEDFESSRLGSNPSLGSTFRTGLGIKVNKPILATIVGSGGLFAGLVILVGIKPASFIALMVASTVLLIYGFCEI